MELEGREVRAIEALVELPTGVTNPRPRRTVLSSDAPGLFDEHGRLLPTNRLEAVFPSTGNGRPFARQRGDEAVRSVDLDPFAFPRERLKPAPNPAFWRWLRDQVSDGPIKLPPEARARVHRFRLGDARLVAIERNIDYQMSEELRQAGGNEVLEEPIELTANLAPLSAPVHLYDLRAERYLGRVTEWTFTLDPWQPSLFVFLPEQQPAEGLVEALSRRIR